MCKFHNINILALGLMMCWPVAQAFGEEPVVLSNESAVIDEAEVVPEAVAPVVAPQAVAEEVVADQAEVVPADPAAANADKPKAPVVGIPSTNPDDALNTHAAWRKRNADLAKKDLAELRRTMYEQAMKNARNTKKK